MSKTKSARNKKQAARILALSKPKPRDVASGDSEKTACADARPTDALSHDEGSMVMMSESQAALKGIMQSRFAAMSERVQSTAAGQIEFANMARDMGRDIQIFTNHQKLLPADFSKLQRDVASNLPEKQTAETVFRNAGITFFKECVSTFVQFPEPVSDLKVARAIYERLEQLMLALPKPSHGEQQRHPDEKVKDLWTESGRLVTEQQRLRDGFEAETDAEKRADLLAQINLYREAIKKQVEKIIEFGEWISSLPTQV